MKVEVKDKVKLSVFLRNNLTWMVGLPPTPPFDKRGDYPSLHKEYYFNSL